MAITAQEAKAFQGTDKFFRFLERRIDRAFREGAEDYRLRCKPTPQILAWVMEKYGKGGWVIESDNKLILIRMPRGSW